MSDPTNWNVDTDISSFEFPSVEMAKEAAKRWNAYPGLVAFVRRACGVGVGRDEALSMLRRLGLENTPTEEGRKRYPPSGFYDEDFACTCLPTCQPHCIGWHDQNTECVCDACTARQNDWWESDRV